MTDENDEHNTYIQLSWSVNIIVDEDKDWCYCWKCEW